MVQKDKKLEPSQVEGEPNPSPVPNDACAEALGPVEEPNIGIELTGQRKFISGVVEGDAFCKELMSFCQLCRFAWRLPDIVNNLLARMVVW